MYIQKYAYAYFLYALQLIQFFVVVVMTNGDHFNIEESDNFSSKS